MPRPGTGHPVDREILHKNAARIAVFVKNLPYSEDLAALPSVFHLLPTSEYEQNPADLFSDRFHGRLPEGARRLSAPMGNKDETVRRQISPSEAHALPFSTANSLLYSESGVQAPPHDASSAHNRC